MSPNFRAKSGHYLIDGTPKRCKNYRTLEMPEKETESLLLSYR